MIAHGTPHFQHMLDGPEKIGVKAGLQSASWQDNVQIEPHYSTCPACISHRWLYSPPSCDLCKPASTLYRLCTRQAYGALRLLHRACRTMLIMMDMPPHMAPSIFCLSIIRDQHPQGLSTSIPARGTQLTGPSGDSINCCRNPSVSMRIVVLACQVLTASVRKCVAMLPRRTAVLARCCRRKTCHEYVLAHDLQSSYAGVI